MYYLVWLMNCNKGKNLNYKRDYKFLKIFLFIVKFKDSLKIFFLMLKTIKCIMKK